MLLAQKSPEKFPKHDFFFKSFALNGYIFLVLANKKLLLPL